MNEIRLIQKMAGRGQAAWRTVMAERNRNLGMKFHEEGRQSVPLKHWKHFPPLHSVTTQKNKAENCT
jgi:hypothetical protein